MKLSSPTWSFLWLQWVQKDDTRCCKKSSIMHYTSHTTRLLRLKKSGDLLYMPDHDQLLSHQGLLVTSRRAFSTAHSVSGTHWICGQLTINQRIWTLLLRIVGCKRENRYFGQSRVTALRKSSGEICRSADKAQSSWETFKGSLRNLAYPCFRTKVMGVREYGELLPPLHYCRNMQS